MGHKLLFTDWNGQTEIDDDPQSYYQADRQYWNNVVPPDAQVGFLAHSRSLPLLDVHAPVRNTMDRGATKDASHDDPDRCQSSSKSPPARSVKPEETNAPVTGEV